MYLRAAKVGTVQSVYPSQIDYERGRRASQGLNKPKIHKLQENVGTVTAEGIMVKEDAGAKGRHTRSMAHKDFLVLRIMENNGNVM